MQILPQTWSLPFLILLRIVAHSTSETSFHYLQIMVYLEENPYPFVQPPHGMWGSAASQASSLLYGHSFLSVSSAHLAVGPTEPLHKIFGPSKTPSAQLRRTASFLHESLCELSFSTKAPPFTPLMPHRLAGVLHITQFHSRILGTFASQGRCGS